MFKKRAFNEFGFAALLALFSVTGLVLIVTFSVSAIILNRTQTSKNLVFSAQSYYSAESGAEDAVLRKLKNYDLPSGALNLDGASVTQNITTIGNATTIDSSSSFSSNVRKTRVRLLVTADSVSFHYGVQVGAGGLEMDNNSTVNGNIYSNGDIEGGSGAKITGDAYVAGGNKIQDVIIGGDAHAHEIETSKICGDAYYQAIDATSLNFLNSPSNPTCSDPLTSGAAHPASPDPETLPAPISASNIDDWKTDAASGGTISGNYSVTNNISLGPKEITGNLVMTSNNKILSVAGTLYVRGNIDISNGSAVQCLASYGENSCVVLADGWIHASNNGTFSGSGAAGSFLMMLTTLQCDGTSATAPDGKACGDHNGAVDIHNQATGVIFYASNGMINLHNGVGITEAAAYKLRLDNLASVTYNQGLVNAAFSSGPGAGWQIDSWNETE